MYVPADAASGIEAVRRVLDPVQSALIPAHITLCREDEIGDASGLANRLANVCFEPLELTFGRPEMFSGHGLLLPCMQGEDRFRQLRECLLASKDIRQQQPHITLAHPRNPPYAGDALAAALGLLETITLAFPTIHLIEQVAGGTWQVLETHLLRG